MQYLLDSSDRILSFDNELMKFAAENGAPNLVQEAIGTVIWKHVRGPVVVELYKQVFDRVRGSRETSEILFRCDAPHLRREMAMSIRHESGGNLAIETRILKETSINHRSETASYTDLYSVKSEPFQLCSGCARLKLDEAWVEAEDILSVVDHLIGFEARLVSHTFCSECVDSYLGIDA